jgi:hypothetical protein
MGKCIFHACLGFSSECVVSGIVCIYLFISATLKKNGSVVLHFYLKQKKNRIAQKSYQTFC